VEGRRVTPVRLALIVRFTLIGALAIGGFVQLSASPAVPVQEPPAAASSPPTKSAFKGTANCQQCHDDAAAKRPDDYFVGKQFAEFARLDPHANATAALDSPLGKRMEKILQTASADRGTWKSVRADKRCLACHGPFIGKYANGAELPPAGVTCEHCHGPASLWISVHGFPEPAAPGVTVWQEMTDEAKKTLGFNPLYDGAVKAKQCYSCHVGQSSANPDEHRVVTHDMYAAGHPPLPPVELATFSERALHHHWLDRSDPRIQKLPRVKKAGPDYESRREIELLTLGSLAAQSNWA